MKFSISLASAVLLAAATSASAGETNAQRLARGLPPAPPRRMYNPSHISAAKRTSPSGQPTNPGGNSQCTTGPVHCCNSVAKASDNHISSILGLLGLGAVDLNSLVGFQCSPLSGVGLGGSQCSSHTVCCENNSQGGLISIGCIPIFLG